MPPGPWLVVLGMHRSGTSAVSGALGGLGFQTPHPDDLMGWHESNPEHWESVSISAYNDELLADLGGSWEAPPDLPPHWEDGAEVGEARNPTSAAGRAFPDAGPLVCKDPRLCILLPHWQHFFPSPPTAVLVWRSPLSVARSLRRRNGLHLAEGIALWERYNRSALEHLVGLDTYVCNYESLVDDPSGTIGSLADWLRSRPQFASESIPWDVGLGISTITARPNADLDSDGELLLAPQRDLIARLAAAGGGHLPMDPMALTSESSWTSAVIAARREGRTRKVEELEASVREKQLALDRLRGSTSWRVTQPLRSIIAGIKGTGRDTG
jgi:hypothetical protein